MTIQRVIARLRRPPFNKSTQEIGDLTPSMISDILASDDEEIYNPSHFGNTNPSARIPEILRPKLR